MIVGAIPSQIELIISEQSWCTISMIGLTLDFTLQIRGVNEQMS
jgi:hypothetical protein